MIPACDTHPDTPLHPTRSGWVCPLGCADYETGRRWRDHPEAK